MPKVSVIMGVYNTNKEYISLAIESILNQTYTDFEYIICNDGCTDDTFEYIKSKYKDSRIVYIENDTNRGLAYTLNHCLNKAQGEYIARMDSDDESLLNRIEEQVDFLDNNKEYGVAATNANLFDENGIWGKLEYNENINKKDFLKNNPVIHPSVMIRREIYDLVNGYRDILRTVRVEDYDLFFRIFAKGAKIYTIQKKLLNYRIDKSMAKKKKYKYRINECWVRLQGYKILKLYPKGLLYVIKPLIVGLIPEKVLRVIKK